MADSILDGLTEGQAAMGVDIGAAEDPVEPALRPKPPELEAPAPEPELEAAFGAEDVTVAEAETLPGPETVEAEEPTESDVAEDAPAEAESEA